MLSNKVDTYWYDKYVEYRRLYLEALVAHPYIIEEADNMFHLSVEDFQFLLEGYNRDNNKPIDSLPDRKFLSLFGPLSINSGDAT